jgi:hypothetical protein
MCIKVGDAVKCIAETSTNYKQIGEVTYVGSEEIEVRYDNGELGRGKFKYYELITRNPINTVVSKIMGVKESFIVGLTPEPQKSYRKAGITNGDGLLTDDGVKVFLTYLLEKTPQFKTDIVDSILEDLKDEKCK